MPRWTLHLAVVGILLTLIPLAMIARERIASHGDRTRVSIIPDMDKQAKFKSQEANPFFADGRAARTEPAGTVARGALMADAAFSRGRADGDWVTEFPLTVDEALVARGQQRFAIYCAPCHGLAGYGDGMVNQRALALGEGGWTPASSFHTEVVRDRPVGHIYNTITQGIRNMPAYGPQLDERDRWAVVAYVRALQLSQNAGLEDVPAEQRDALMQERGTR